jgi:hypothetical protein
MFNRENSIDQRKASMPSTKLEYLTPDQLPVKRQTLVTLNQEVSAESPDSKQI